MEEGIDIKFFIWGGGGGFLFALRILLQLQKRIWDSILYIESDWDGEMLK